MAFVKRFKRKWEICAIGFLRESGVIVKLLLAFKGLCLVKFYFIIFFFG